MNSFVPPSPTNNGASPGRTLKFLSALGSPKL
jgi:hypothetical protein